MISEMKKVKTDKLSIAVHSDKKQLEWGLRYVELKWI